MNSKATRRDKIWIQQNANRWKPKPSKFARPQIEIDQSCINREEDPLEAERQRIKSFIEDFRKDIKG